MEGDVLCAKPHGSVEETACCHLAKQRQGQHQSRQRYVFFKSIIPLFILQAFRLISGSDERVFAAGLRMAVIVQYSPKDEGSSHRGVLEVFADDKLVLAIPMLG